MNLQDRFITRYLFSFFFIGCSWVNPLSSKSVSPDSNRAPQSENESYTENWEKAYNERMQVRTAKSRRLSLADQREFYKDYFNFIPELHFHIDNGNTADAERIFNMYNVWNQDLEGLSGDSKLTHSIGDELITTNSLKGLQQLQNMGFDPQMASEETLARVSTYPEFSKASGELRALFGSRLEMYWEKNKTNPNRVIGLDGPAAENVEENVMAAFLESMRQDLVLEDLEDLSKISPCFNSLADSEALASKFCTVLYNFYTNDIPKKIEERVVQFKSEKEQFGLCELEASVSIKNKKIQNSHTGSPSDKNRSEITVTPFLQIVREGKTLLREDRESQATVPLFGFFKASTKFCKSIVIVIQEKDGKRKAVFNQDNPKFKGLFQLPTNLGSKTPRLQNTEADQ